MSRYLLFKKKGVSSVNEKIRTSGKNYKVAQNFRVSLDEKTKSS